jgi:hypothetical protein
VIASNTPITFDIVFGLFIVGMLTLAGFVFHFSRRSKR